MITLEILEGWLEKVSTVLLIIGAIFLILSLFMIPSISITKKMKRLFYLILMIGIVLLIFMIGEEISWGQRIFGWETPDTMKLYNYQNETNLHNFINPILPLFYPLFGMTSFLLLLIFWGFSIKHSNVFYGIFIPPPSFFMLFLFMAVTSLTNEIFEAIFSLFIFFYTLRILFCWKNLSLSKKRSSGN